MTCATFCSSEKSFSPYSVPSRSTNDSTTPRRASADNSVCGTNTGLGLCSSKWASTSTAHEFVHVVQAIHVTERAVILDLPCRVDEAAHRGAVKGSRKADAPDARCLELCHAERFTRHADHEIHRL